MTPEVREKVRRMRTKLCSMAEEYKGVREKSCMQCESPCAHGRDLLKLLSIEPPHRLTVQDVFEPVHLGRDGKSRRIIKATNRRFK